MQRFGLTRGNTIEVEKDWNLEEFENFCINNRVTFVCDVSIHNSIDCIFNCEDMILIINEQIKLEKINYIKDVIKSEVCKKKC